MVSRGNRVRELRAARGFTQAELAAAVGLSRQSVYAIEAGHSLPAVDIALRLARALECSIEQLFGEPASESRLSAEPVGNAAPGRVALSHIAGRWLSYSLARDPAVRAAHGIAGKAARGHVPIDALCSLAEARDTVVLMGCAPALGLLADRLNARSGPGRFLWLTRSSTGALESLALQQAHVAGVHLVDRKTGEANLPDVRRLVAKRSLVLVTLASWEAGWVTAPGNPQGIVASPHFGAKGPRLAAREAGSGARRLLDQALESAGLPASVASRAAVQASSHVEVAHAVALGAADAGIATRDAALLFGLGFVPLAQERYDLVLGRDDLDDPRLCRLFDAMSSGPFRKELSALGYDVGQCGARVAEILAA